VGDVVASPVFVGRVAEARALDRALDLAAGGTPAVVLVAGEAGIGKTRLIGETLARRGQVDLQVLAGGCSGFDGHRLEYGPLLAALHSHRSELAGVLTALPGTGTGSLEPSPSRSCRSRRFVLLADLLDRLAERSPVALVVEDLHWADRRTLEFLAYLGASLSTQRHAVVASYRSDEVGIERPLHRWLVERRRHALVTEIGLGPLTRDEVDAQLAGILCAPPPAWLVDDVYARSAGNPYFTEQLVAACRDGQDGLPEPLLDMMRSRLGEVSALARRVIDLVSVADGPVGHPLLARASRRAGLTEDQLLSGLQETVRSRVLRSTPPGDGYLFRHRLLAEAAYQQLLPGERVRLHRAFAEALSAGAIGAADEENAGALAVHFERAHDAARAFDWSLRAATAAEAGSGFAEAAGHYGRAVRLWQVVQAPELFAGMDRAELLCRTARCEDYGGLASDLALGHIEEAIGLVDETTDAARASRLRERRLRYLVVAGRTAGALAPSSPASSSPASPPPASPPPASPPVEASREHLRRARLDGDPVEISLACGRYGTALTHLGRDAEAVQIWAAGYRAARERGVGRRYGGWLLTLAARTLFALGRWDECAAELRRVQAERPDGIVALRMHDIAAALAVGRGEYGAAEAELAARRGPGDSPSPPRDQGYYEQAAELGLWRGDLDAAAEAVATGLRELAATGTATTAQAGMLRWLGMRCAADRAELARARHDPGALATAVEDAAKLAAPVPAPVPAPAPAPATAPNPEADPGQDGPRAAATRACWEAERSRLAGRSEPALWTEAVSAWDERGFPYPSAYARWRAAEALLGSQASREAAGGYLREAHAVAVQLGAAPLRREIEALARLARIPLESSAVGQAADPAPGGQLGLTARELEVLCRLTAGQTNREIATALFISTKTASVHVSNLLRKLGVADRRQAAAVAHRLGLTAGRTAGRTAVR
jgi:DNA-binding CsgD family transcriptional regulator